jgi:RNA polymerase sigma-70 factor (ECF subfamily)
VKIQTLSDENLMLRVAKNDVPAFEEVYARYSMRILNYFYRMLAGNQDKAQDFLQDLFVKVLEKAYTFDPGEKLSTWIYTIAHNMCRNEYRHQSVRKKAAQNGSLLENYKNIDNNNQDQAIDLQIMKDALNSEVDKMDENHRSTFILRYQQNLSIKDISKVLECSEGTTKSRLHYTTRALTLKLKEYNPI